jgi:hypothetical protein
MQQIDNENYALEYNFVDSKNKSDINKSEKQDKFRDKELLELEQDRKFKLRIDELNSKITNLKYQHYSELDDNQKEKQLKALISEAIYESKSTNNFKKEE